MRHASIPAQSANRTGPWHHQNTQFNAAENLSRYGRKTSANSKRRRLIKKLHRCTQYRHLEKPASEKITKYKDNQQRQVQRKHANQHPRLEKTKLDVLPAAIAYKAKRQVITSRHSETEKKCVTALYGDYTLGCPPHHVREKP